MARGRTTRRARHIARLLALGLVALLLASCFKFDTALTVSSDDTVSGTIIFGFDRALLEMGGGTLDDLMGEDLAPVPDDVEGVTVEEWEDDDFVGQEFTLDAVPLEAFNEDSEAGALRIERDGDVFRLSGNMDLSSGLEDLGGEDLGMDPTAFLDDVELDISVTFPGEVLETNGQVEGTTVTWEPEIGSANEIIAVAEAEPSVSSSGILWILLVVGLLVVALVLYVLLRRRRKPMVTTGEPVEGRPTDEPVGATATGPAPPGQAATPDTATPDVATQPPPPGGAPTAAPPPSPAPSPAPPPPGGDDTTELPGSRDDTTPLPPPPPPG